MPRSAACVSLRYSALMASWRSGALPVPVSWGFRVLAGWGRLHLMGAGRSAGAGVPGPGATALTGLRAKSALVLGDYGFPHARNSWNWSALRHGAYAGGPCPEGHRRRDGPDRPRRRGPAAQG